RYWHDPETLWRHALAVDPANHRAHAQLGQYLLPRAGLAAAREHFEAAVRLAPRLGDYQYHLGVTLLLQGEWEAAAGPFEEVLKRNPQNAGVWYCLGEARLH